MSEILKLVKKFDEYRSKCLNLQASENIMSRDARAALGSGMASRYSHVDHETQENSYGGASIIEEIEESVRKMASKLYRSKYAEVRPIGGHVALESTLISILKKGDSFLYIHEKDGGYPGYRQDMIPGMFGFTGIPIPYFYDRQEIDFYGLEKVVKERKPRAIVLGQSAFVKEYDLGRINEIAWNYDLKVIYDGSHVMGLIAGKGFQTDAIFRSDVLLGSTHKTFFGPQGGIILTNDGDLINRISENMIWKTMDNYHPSRLAALGVSMEEMIATGEEYASAVVRNSKSLGKVLNDLKIGIKFDPWFSFTHQLIIDEKSISRRSLDRISFSKTLEKNRIIVDRDGRIGTSEISRLGLHDMDRVGELINKALSNEEVTKEVTDLISGLQSKYW
ncbi:MAG: serine hydroxymethyltransferase [Thermoplasmata archaeon]